MNFENMKISRETIGALKRMGIETTFPVQEKSIPALLEGKGVGVRAKTGSGKTIAFAVPIIETIEHKGYPQVLVVSPTRELALQTYTVIRKLTGKLKLAIIYGGVGYRPQLDQLRDADIVVGTPGRLLDLLNKGNLSLSSVETVVLDEADRLLDMGFLPDVEKLLRQPKNSRLWLFSATLGRDIMKLAKRYGVSEFVKVGEEMPTEIEHLFVDQGHKITNLRQFLGKNKVLVFTSTKRMARKLSEILRVPTIHGDMSQNAREKSLRQFKNGATVLIATDVAARGLDIPNVETVVNFDIPNDSKTYIHRAGRTGRAGKTGRVVNLLRDQDYDAFRKISGTLNLELRRA
ncbi:MAG: DEAD/DEAH box helicase [Candidatus Altiarchaeota archaeon]|nr:DEAD/DEAH box helicase [Candidatus Altiarchaeota archaeon]